METVWATECECACGNLYGRWIEDTVSFFPMSKGRRSISNDTDKGNILAEKNLLPTSDKYSFQVGGFSFLLPSHTPNLGDSMLPPFYLFVVLCSLG